MRAIYQKLPLFVGEIIEEMDTVEHGIDIFFVGLHSFLDELHYLFLLYCEDCYLRSYHTDGLASWRVETGSIMAEVLSLSKGFNDRTIYLYANAAFAD